MILLVLICIGINMAGSRLMSALEWPLYMDCIGTVIAAAMCGYLPGIAVGIFTNLFKSLFDVSSVYYSIINTLVAILVYLVAKKGYLKKLYGAAGLILIITAIGVTYELILAAIMEGSISDVPIIHDTLIGLA